MVESSARVCGTTPRANRGYEVVTNGFNGLTGKRFHFIGAGGIGMSGLAALLVKHKAVVTGSDQAGGAVIDRLRLAGADIRLGHKEHNLDAAADAVVISAAIRDDNPELKLARQRGIRVYKYAEMLGRIFNYYTGIAVAGTHGKSTTSAWLAYCLKQAGLSPTFIVGADIPQLGGNSGIGDGRHFVAEACEYDRSFLNLKPHIGCILNIEQDHLDYYRDEKEIVDAFCEFARGIKPGGLLVANGDDANLARVIPDFRASAAIRGGFCGENAGIVHCATFGFGRQCAFRAENLDDAGGLYAFDAFHGDDLLGRVRLNIPGRHNVANALAVIAAATAVGMAAKELVEILPGFTGVDRRLMFKAQVNGISILDDYAHHPTEIRASLKAIRERYRPKRLWCIFQPHQYSRTRFLLDDFAESFKLADITIVPEIYFVRDSLAARKEVNAGILVDRICGNGSKAVFIDGFSAICEYLKKNVAEGDVVVTMGAGDVWKIADEYIQWLGAGGRG